MSDIDITGTPISLHEIANNCDRIIKNWIEELETSNTEEQLWPFIESNSWWRMNA